MSSKIQSIQDAFLFSAPAPTLNVPSTARKVHLRRLYDVLQLSIHRNDLFRARRAWSILVRCKEINWMTMWGIAIHLVEESLYENEGPKKIEMLRDMILHYPDERVDLLKELIFQLIQAGHHREALDELELYLPSFPYQDNPVLHIYAGLLCFYLSQENSSPEKSTTTFQPSLLREATSHFERARELDTDNIVAVSFMDKIAIRSLESNIQATQLDESDDESMVLDDSPPKAKRFRQTMSSP
ncbi:hypothetical protein BT96DRAFT_912909 [Gymnopus androsaceus JB14]|uniref:Uncharacterized protein n=1 Tax=Gymnopus androsaceus JB14 TaxID=1447944 RepID=A0A6A4ILU6_9AGAR|nr:hypothetical protein BT96DRAFT_912909 [Gymnopus androsaceus JB14]